MIMQRNLFLYAMMGLLEVITFGNSISYYIILDRYLFNIKPFLSLKLLFFVFLIREATTDDGKDKWIFYQEGGGWCYDDLSCLKRIATNHLISSKGWKDEISKSGIFDMVRLKNLCSSYLFHYHH